MSTLPPPEKYCAYCKKDLGENTRRRIYCGSLCAGRAQSISYYGKRKDSYEGIPTGTTGAIHELNVCSDLLKKGYHVYRAVSPSAVCDLVILGEFKLLKIEVTTGHRTANCGIVHPKKDFSKFDILAIALHDGTIVYEPDLENWNTVQHKVRKTPKQQLEK